MIARLKSLPWQREAFIFTCAILVFSVTGPFGTYQDLNFVDRVIYWSIAILGCGVFFWIIIYQAIYHPILSALSKLPRLLIGAALAAVPASLVVYFLQVNFRNIPVPTERLPWLWFVVFFVGVGIGVTYFISPFGKGLFPQPDLTSKQNPFDAAKEPSQPPEFERFLSRLPNKIGNHLTSISMHDHYVEVTTRRGKAMIHMKFKNALEELRDYPGTRIHRSHWIAKDSVESVKKSGRSFVALLSDGQCLPVSKTYQDAVSRYVDT